MAYVATEKEQQFVVCGQLRRRAWLLDAIVQSEDEPWIAFDGPDTFHYMAVRGNDLYVVYERMQ